MTRYALLKTQLGTWLCFIQCAGVVVASCAQDTSGYFRITHYVTVTGYFRVTHYVTVTGYFRIACFSTGYFRITEYAAGYFRITEYVTTGYFRITLFRTTNVLC